MIYCKYCNQHKNIIEFSASRLNKTPKCKECISLYSKEFYKRNRLRLIEKSKRYQQSNIKNILKKKAIYRKNNKQKISEYDKKYIANNKDILKEKRNNRQKLKRKNDILFRLKQNISNAINCMLKKLSGSKNKQSCSMYLPFNMVELKIHIESLFNHPDNLTQNGEVWMNFGNQGKFYPKDYKYIDDTKKYLINYANAKWQIDHIIPQLDLPYSSMNDDNFKKCWSLDNLRPLRADINNKDGVNKTRHSKLIKIL